MRIVFVIILTVFAAAPVMAADKMVTLYFDGAKVEVVATSAKGFADVVLPAAMLPDSLRIKPAPGVTIDRIETLPFPVRQKQAGQLEKLMEREEQLQDRLKALATREEIFIAAAKSQSARTPRKTKNNPEPLSTIRQGTDFAIAQLEGVYQARRKAEKELKQVQSRLISLKKATNTGGSIARIWLKGRGGKVRVSYLVSDLNWIPQYDFRLDHDGRLRFIMRGVIPPVEKGTSLSVIPALMAGNHDRQPVAFVNEVQKVIEEKIFPVENVTFQTSAYPALSFSTTNNTPQNIPTAEVSCYYHGEYLGRTKFPGVASGQTTNITCGR